MNLFRLALRSFLFVAVTGPLLAQGTYTQIDYPGAVQTYAAGINSAGDVVGMYLDSTPMQHGFLLRGGTFITIDDPNGGWTFLMGMNDKGKIVGYGAIAFVYDIQSQRFTNIGIGNLPTSPQAINNFGTVVGYVVDSKSPKDLYETGFELSAQGQRKRIEVVGATSTLPWGISDSGIVVGFGDLHGSYYDFIFNGQNYDLLGLGTAFRPVVLGINPQGTALVGWYVPSGVLSGFLYQNKKVTTLQFPGAQGTVPYDVNSVGEVVGYFTGLDSRAHGFMWTPPADASH
ncbi:MAG TPA: hypothetical protein VH437_05415 [Terriglobales bacterium]|jgi:probable HAF family extracellular repeat protein